MGDKISDLATAGFIMLVFVLSASAQLTYDFYQKSCPNVFSIVGSVVQNAVKNETRMAASLLRLHFHDCFVNGCDGSVLLDDTATFTGEKNAFPNAGSLRGFNVVDDIKTALERECNGTVSCADILAIAARDSVMLAGGPSWWVLLGRRDSTTASQAAANQNIPAPTDSLSTLISKFQAVGLSVQDMVTLSGAHTFGRARCTSFSTRLYNFNSTGQPDSTLQQSYLSTLQSTCPQGGDPNAVAPLDIITPNYFDNCYFRLLQTNKGLLQSDQELYSTPNASTIPLVNNYAANWYKFLNDFRSSMLKMGNISSLTGTSGQIRRNCRVVNSA
eukprot:c49206_g1_i1 orf=337-1326(-)